MRKFLFIFFAILAYLALSSKSCSSNEQEEAARNDAELTKTRVSIKNEFESGDLSRKSLRAFEIKAKQELVDFSDYLHIYSDKKLDESFKSQARRMILDMFISDSVRINNLLSKDSGGTNMRINEFLTLDSAAVYNSMDFIFDEIRIAEPFHRTDEYNYKGKLTFLRHVKFCSASDTVTADPARMEADIFVSKVFKPFGADTLQVWGIFLGGIK